MKKIWKKVFFHLDQNLHVIPTTFSKKIPIDDLLNEIQRFVYARAKVSLHFRLDNY